METFEKLKAIWRNIIVNIFKWAIVFIISAILDLLLLLILRSKMLKMVVNISSYWVLGPIAQLDLMQDCSTANVLKVIFCFLIIIISQSLEYITYKDLVVE